MFLFNIKVSRKERLQSTGRGLGDSASGNNCSQSLKHEFDLQYQEKDSAEWFTLVNQLKEEAEDPWGSQATQLNPMSEPQARERHYLKKKSNESQS